jgi:hypothetical protein
MLFSKFILRRCLPLALVAVLCAACGGGGGSPPATGASADASTGSSTAPPVAGNNVVAITVDAGPEGTGYNANRLYAEVTICQPGSTSACQTIDHVLVDTGSVGLRVLSSAIPAGLNLVAQTGNAGLPLLSCAQFVDNTFAWGPVVTADVALGAKRASAVPVQVIADPAYNKLQGACSTTGNALTSAAILGAKGILGVGLFQQDCGQRCTTTLANGYYYTCSGAACLTATRSTASIAQQIKNPVPLFATDNNGLVIDLPSVSNSGATSVIGSMIFGVGTQSNNQVSGSTLLMTNASGNITTVFAGRQLTDSFLDTGSNGLYFDSSTIVGCTGNAIGFYCPASLTALSATLSGTNGLSIPVTFAIDNALNLFAGVSNIVLPTLSGTIGSSRTFDWGLPFFLGRRVAFGIEGQPSALGTGPYYAF